MGVACWHILTGEYPPRPGGIADYTRSVAGGLARSGAEVHVWCPDAEGEAPAEEPGVAVHRILGRRSRADLARLGAELDTFAPPRRLLVQYATNPWGFRGANVGFCRWLVRRRRLGDDIRTMVHEAFYPWKLRDRPTRWVLAAAHRLMLRSLLAASSRVYYSMPYWEPRLRAYEPRPRRPMVWLPIPSSVPLVAGPAGVAALRQRLAPGGRLIVGNFGTYGPDLRAQLHRILAPLLTNHTDRVGLLIGRGGRVLADELRAAHPGLADRLVATGGLPAGALSLYLQVCDVLVQPYEFGVSSRRSTVMAGLEHGLPIATSFGYVTEPIWAESGCVALAPCDDPPALVQAAEGLLADRGASARLGARAREVYDRHFALERTVEALLGAGAVASR
jgi:glycosyltransferase involved in cell wall biosynthesis